MPHSFVVRTTGSRPQRGLIQCVKKVGHSVIGDQFNPSRWKWCCCCLGDRFAGRVIEDANIFILVDHRIRCRSNIGGFARGCHHSFGWSWFVDHQFDGSRPLSCLIRGTIIVFGPIVQGQFHPTQWQWRVVVNVDFDCWRVAFRFGKRRGWFRRGSRPLCRLIRRTIKVGRSLPCDEFHPSIRKLCDGFHHCCGFSITVIVRDGAPQDGRFFGRTTGTVGMKFGGASRWWS